MRDADYERSRLGVGIVGSGRMGTHRARLASMHPGVDYVALTDIAPAKAEALAERVGAQAVHADARELAADPRVSAVVVSTSEPEHVAPALAAIEAGKPVLIEKPIATSRDDADAIIEAAHANDVTVRVGYSQRFRRNTFLGKQHTDDGKLGRVIGGVARVFNTRAHAFAILERSPHVSPVVDVLTYYIDLIDWYMGDNAPVEVYAAGHGTVLRDKVGPDGPDDITHAIVRYADGAVVSFTIGYSLPAEVPLMGQGSRVELVGTDGVLLLDGDHRQDVIFSEHGVAHSYVQGHEQNLGYLGSTSSGDWALGRMFGPLADETRSWLDHLATGATMQLTTPGEARQALEVTLALEEAARSAAPVKIRPVDVPTLP